MKKSTAIGLSILTLLLAACSKNGEVAEFVKENDALVTEIGKATSADAAKQVFESKKEALKTKLAPIKEARGFQLSKESQESLTRTLTDGAGAICGLQLKAIGNDTDSAKYKSICDDYSALM